MVALPQFDYIFAIATIFAFLDAWNIGMFRLSCIVVCRALQNLLSLS